MRCFAIFLLSSFLSLAGSITEVSNLETFKAEIKTRDRDALVVVDVD